MTLSNLKTEKSLVENAEETEKHMVTFVFSVKETMLLCTLKEIEDSQRTAAIDRMSSFSSVSCFS